VYRTATVACLSASALMVAAGCTAQFAHACADEAMIRPLVAEFRDEVALRLIGIPRSAFPARILRCGVEPNRRRESSFAEGGWDQLLTKRLDVLRLARSASSSSV
jgi:hypothetical protein